MSKIYLVRGPAASGKSSIAKAIKEKIPEIIHLDIDSFKHLISNKSSKKRSDIAHNVSLVFIEELIKHDYNIVIEEIFRPDFYYRTMEKLNKLDVKILQIHITAPLDILIKRSNEREKNKDEKVIIKLFKEIKPLKGEVVYDSSKLSIDEIVSEIIS